ncbi:hypothetical protein SUGI_0661580 [Cryptomeria japonica]|uniref:ylmG homolog protein 1-2, chloroplastic isoform X2 n=1 Tax=Cryptomeria japonica TaxID=3369 RepID=UPI0024147C12|nr:ylmG homolog protein 1-2, chloroplastic isoform X2 [Cryptomeria japonica]GLJ32845.1 hypothetical protein SUGI_0661580 [Cryptomeria japonica]
MAAAYAFVSTISFHASSASSRLLSTKCCKQLTRDCKNRNTQRLLPHIKYCVKNIHLIRGRGLVSSFFKETGKITVMNKVKRALFQNLVTLLGISVVHSGLCFSDVASAIPLVGVDEMVGGIHGIMLGDLDPSTANIVINILSPVFLAFNVLFIVRIIMTWYPQLPVGKFPYVIAYAPTEPFLSPTRKVIPPVAGVDVSPIVWFAIVSFLNEILLGQQGLLRLISQQNV